MSWGWEKNTLKRMPKRIKTRKNSPLCCPLMPPSTTWGSTVFRCSGTPKTSQTYLKWELFII